VLRKSIQLDLIKTEGILAWTEWNILNVNDQHKLKMKPKRAADSEYQSMISKSDKEVIDNNISAIT